MTTLLLVGIAFTVGWCASRWNEERKFWKAMAQVDGERTRAEHPSKFSP